MRSVQSHHFGAKSRQGGFTLIEIMVVVIIIGLLAGIATPIVMDKVEGARVQKVRADFQAFKTALQLYKLDNFLVPTGDQGLQALLVKPSLAPVPRNWKAGGYIEELKVDPWGNAYLYMSPGEGHEYDIYTLGADGVSGGEGPAADIHIWQAQEKSE
jgi:general secretion pathway protein G